MGNRNFRARRVYQQAQTLVGTKVLARTRREERAPAWFKAIEAIPPAEILVRTYPVQHSEPNPRLKRPHETFRPTRIVYLEDTLRSEFYKDHPWELARPMLLVENDGRDAGLRDWSKGLEQPGLRLSGENVVQRQLWLMENDHLSKEQAYDQARHELYQLRHEEEVERRVAKEEAQMVGAYFGMSAMRVGMHLENKQYNKWRDWAASEISRLSTKRAEAYTSFGNNDDMHDYVKELEGFEAGAAAPVEKAVPGGRS